MLGLLGTLSRFRGTSSPDNTQDLMRDTRYLQVGYRRTTWQLGLIALACLIIFPRTLSATPETFVEPFVSFKGSSTGARFGDSLSCSSVSVSGGNRSFFAVGAPDEQGARGAVYLYDSNDPDTPAQRLSAPTPAAGLRFGAAVVFVDDINGDGADDLVVGEPSGAQGTIHVFGSDLSQGVARYSFCASSSHESSLGAQLLALRGQGGSTETLVASAPSSGSTYSFDISGACSGGFGLGFRFTRLNQGGEFGSSLAEVSSTFLMPVATPGASVTESKVLVGQPSFSGLAGKTQLLTGAGLSAEFRYGEFGLGSSVAGSRRSSLAVIGSPQRGSGAGAVDVVNGDGELMCSVAQQEQPAGQGFGRSVAHLEDAFSGALGSDASFAASRPEAETGGSLALFGFRSSSSACTSQLQVNNCEEDVAQEQAKVVVGGPDCIVRRNGLGRASAAFSSPGWQAGRGRVDLIVDGSESALPISCSQAGPIAPFETPIPVEPGDNSLPGAQVSVSGKKVTVHMPLLDPQLTGDNYERARRKLERQGLSPRETRKALRKLEVTYVIKVKTTAKKGGVASVSTRTVTINRSSWQYRRKRNTVTLSNLTAGTYSLNWSAIISTRRPPVVLGQASSPTTTRFTITKR